MEPADSLSGRSRLRRALVLRSWSAEAPAKAGRCKTTRDDRDHRHALCSLSHGLPAYRRGAHRAVQLALCPRTRREDAAADRGYRPRALHAGRDRGHPRWARLARPELGRRDRLPILALRAPPQGGPGAVGSGPRLSLLRLARGTRADAREGAQRRAYQAL